MRLDSRASSLANLFPSMLGLFCIGTALSPAVAQAPASLGTVAVPLPANLDTFVKDRTVAIQLGKALLWDQQTGGDGQIACANCHFSSGVDARVINTVNPGPNHLFDGVPSPGGTLTAADFPIQGDNIVGSQGIVRADFVALDPGSATAEDTRTLVNDGIFFPERQVTGRNTPSTIMAIFNRDNFWDGRAKREFNGVNPAGVVPGVTILVDDGAGLVPLAVNINPASAASQSVGPPNNGVEMSAAGRTFAQLGRKLLKRTPLGLQQVAVDDSVLGGLSASPADGLSTSYGDLIEAAIQDRFWASSQVTAAGFTQMEANFSLFWGLSVMLYESTLIPDNAPFDLWREGLGSISASAQAGLNIFMTQGRCIQCHKGPEFTAASIMNRSGGSAFANTGVTPTAADGGRQPENKGKFKTPTLRNVELTGPYFHNGRYLTLMQVVDFYNRGGDVANKDKDSAIRPLGLSETQKNQLVDFLLTLTDPRVAMEQAPFDRPSINVPNGPSLAAVGAGGSGSPIGAFLGADHHSH